MAQSPVMDSLRALDRAAMDAYWKRKDLGEALRRFEELLARIHAAGGEDLRAIEMSACYNYASFAYPGWDEPGISTEGVDWDRALRHALRNGDLAVELNKGPVAVSRGHWIVGAMHLARREYREARAAFLQAAEGSEGDGFERGELAFNRAYAALADDCAGVDGARAEWQGIVHELKREGAAEYANQVAAAGRVFLGCA